LPADREELACSQHRVRCNSCRLRHRPVSRVAMGMHPRWKLDVAQLVATAAYVDPDFVQKAVRLVADHSTYFKSIVPLAETSRRARLNRAGGQHGGSQSARGSHDRQRQLRHHRLGLASEPARSLRVDVSKAGLNDSFEALKSHRRKTALGCGINRSMQHFGGIVRRVFRSLVFFLGAHSISLPLR
jgi:hypothetical protein